MKKFAIILLVFFFGFLSCKNNASEDDKSSETSNSEIVKESETLTLCYKKEFTFKDQPNQKDVQELRLVLNGEKATGVYNWLPAFKDQRKGSFHGIFKNNTITAEYIFMQEGIADTTNLKIILLNNEASVEGGEPSLGLNATLLQVDCK